MFRFNNCKDDLEKILRINEMKSAFGNLKSKIDVVQSYKVAVNEKITQFSYDLTILSEYTSWEDLELYLNHPEHQKAISLCKHIEKQKAVIDYEFEDKKL